MDHTVKQQWRRFSIVRRCCSPAARDSVSQSRASPLQAVQPALADVSNQHVSRSAEAGPKAPAHITHEELVQVKALE
jgi:hypothetical protein